MKYYVSAALVLILAVWLQINFLGGLRPLGIVPNLLLVALAFWAFLRPASQTITAALIGGLILDLASGTDFGLRMAFYTFFVLGVIYWRQLGATETAVSIASAVTAGTVIYNLAVLANLMRVHGAIDWLVAVRLIGLELILNLLLALLLRRLLIWSLRAQEGSFGEIRT